MQLGLPIDSDHQGHEPFQGNLVNSPAMNHAVPILEPVRKHIISSLEMSKDYVSSCSYHFQINLISLQANYPAGLILVAHRV